MPYFGNASFTCSNAANFSGTKVMQFDPKTDFQWAANSPVPGMVNPTYSIRWTRSLQPQYSGPVFIIRAGDGSPLGWS